MGQAHRAQRTINKLPFNKTDLLENYTIKENGYGGMAAKLINKYVKIIISIEQGVIFLIGFYKQPGIAKKGIARCGLYVLLKKLLEDEIIEKSQIMKVSSPTPDDGDMERLIKIYTQIGFTRGDPEPGNPINLYATIEKLIKTLEKQCEIRQGTRESNICSLRF
tara:strand:+ start:97 stop:588 length:492 start_codon:yes stop_codon:yes gene_type:complete